jgi:hypothetical protein
MRVILLLSLVVGSGEVGLVGLIFPLAAKEERH